MNEATQLVYAKQFNGGIAIGVASDELRRHGLDAEKRTRLIIAGAHIIIPDYSQSELLIRLLLG